MKLLTVLALLILSNLDAQTSILLKANNWNLQSSFSNAKIQVRNLPNGGGIYFDFPSATSGNWVGYFTTSYKAPINISAGTMLSVTFQVVASSTTTYNYDSEPSNICPTLANLRPYIQRVGWDLGWSNWDGNVADAPISQYYRWWSNPIAYTLVGGSNVVTLNIPLAGSQWSSVFGVYGNDPIAGNTFADSLSNVNGIGVTFGGGCFFGHGVNVSGGSAEFQLLSYNIF